MTDNNQNDLKDELKSVLIARYRKIFVDKLTPLDLEELQSLLKNKFDTRRTINQEYLLKFEHRLRNYFPEEILRREMAGIETLVEKLRPGDLKKKS